MPYFVRCKDFQCGSEFHQRLSVDEFANEEHLHMLAHEKGWERNGALWVCPSCRQPATDPGAISDDHIGQISDMARKIAQEEIGLAFRRLKGLATKEQLAPWLLDLLEGEAIEIPF